MDPVLRGAEVCVQKHYIFRSETKPLPEFVSNKFVENDHPYYNFGIGNKTTLEKPNIRKELLKSPQFWIGLILVIVSFFFMYSIVNWILLITGAILVISVKYKGNKLDF